MKQAVFFGIRIHCFGLAPLPPAIFWATKPAEVSLKSLFREPLVPSAECTIAASCHPTLESKELTDLIKVLISPRSLPINSPTSSDS
jgi:hypothetical protein